MSNFASANIFFNHPSNMKIDYFVLLLLIPPPCIVTNSVYLTEIFSIYQHVRFTNTVTQRQQNRTQNTTKSHSFFSHIAKCFNGHWFGLCGPSKKTWRQRMSWRRYSKAMDGDELGRAPGKVIGNRWNLIFLCIDLFTIAWVNIYLVSRWCSVYIISFVFFHRIVFFRFVSFRFCSGAALDL